MSYINFPKQVDEFLGIVPIGSGWNVLFAWSRELPKQYWQMPIVALAHFRDEYGHHLLCPIVSDREIGASWKVVGYPNEDDYMIGVSGPGEEDLDADEIEARTLVVLEIMDEHRSAQPTRASTVTAAPVELAATNVFFQ
jgi:hypothetical protein